MTQGEFYYLLMVIGAMVVFASVLAYGSWVAGGNARKTARIEAFPQKTDRPELGADTKEAA